MNHLSPSMKRVAHFIDTGVPGGAEVLLIEICKRLQDYNFQPEVYHFGNWWLEKKCNELNIPIFIVPGHKYYKSIKTLPIFNLMFYRFIRQRKIDILHSHLFGPITGSCVATFLNRTPHIGTIHDTYTIDEKKTRIQMLRWASILGTKLVTVASTMQEYLQKIGNLKDGVIETVYNGVQINPFQTSGNSSLRKSLDLNDDDFVFICVGRLIGIKRHDFLIEAFNRLKPIDLVKLLIVGEGPERKKIEAMIIQKDLHKNVKLLGFRDDIAELLKISDCFLLASTTEGLSCSIAEAMAAGLPLVVTDVGGNKELVEDDRCGYIVPVNDLNLFAEKMQYLINNKEKRILFGTRSALIVKEKFSMDRMIGKYVDIYQRMTK